ncbi:MAG: hypothetical protein II978_05900 [Clostridia bacterium]|nr:hypothetical protein [Clostridia bacterium]
MKKFMKVVSLICVMLVLCLALPVFTSTNAVGERVGIDCYYNNDGDAEAALAFNNFTYDFKAYFAIYDDSGKLVGISSKDIAQDVASEKLVIPMDNIFYGVDCKVFLWGADSLTPVRDFYEEKLTSRASLNEEYLLEYINGNTISPQGLRRILSDCYETKIINVGFDALQLEDDVWFEIYDKIICDLYFDIEQFEDYLLKIYDIIVVGKDQALAVVYGISTVSDDRKKISFLQYNWFQSYVVSKDCVGLDDISAGDVFQYKLDGDEIISGIKIADYDKTTKKITLEKDLDKDAIKYIDGKVTDKETKYIVVDGSEYTFANSDEVGTVAVYNTARSGKNAVTYYSSLSSLKKSGATYTYNIIARLEDNKIVDAIEYQTATVAETPVTTEEPNDPTEVPTELPMPSTAPVTYAPEA